MFKISTYGLELSFHEPGDGFYEGTRFDRSGLFDSLVFRGTELCGRWFEHYDPKAHDAVCGPVEEFAPVGFGSAAPGGTFFKPGAGLLVRPDDAPYDRFRLYQIADPGEWTVRRESDRIAFRHRLEGVYDYVKEIVLTDASRMEIRHSLTPVTPLDTTVYNHNFFTFGRMSVGPSRCVDFPFAPECTWRASYDSVALTPSGIRFSRQLTPGESVYTGDIHVAGAAGMPYRIRLSEGSLAVSIEGDVPVTHTVFWANHRVACPEPYNRVAASAGDTFRWTIKYRFDYD